MPVEIALADASPHALVGGPSGSGKTNLLLTMISSLAVRYDPDELELYLLDFKEGVSFAQFTPGRRDTTWLPHARLVGVNINTDREFGLALLRFLAEEMRRRAEAAKAYEVTKLEELRAADPDGRWPRIVAIVDEFQYLFGERDEVTKAATALLEDVARRGRSQGIHLVLASQDVSGIEAFWGRPAIFEQFVLRIGLPRARHVLADLNDATLGLSRWHAVVTTSRGSDTGTRSCGSRSHRRHRRPARTARDVRGWPGPPPPLRRQPGSAVSRAGHRARSGRRATARAARAAHRRGGQRGDRPVARRAGPQRRRDRFRRHGRRPGARRGRGLARQAVRAGRCRRRARRARARGGRPGGPARAGVRNRGALLSRRSGSTASATRVEGLAAEVTARLADGADRPRRTTLVVLYGADAADPVLERGGMEALRQLLRFGPETGRARARLVAQRPTAQVGRCRSRHRPTTSAAWVGLDVQGAELGVLAPGMILHWSPRPGRGLFFDRAQHARPDVIIVPALEEEP